MLLVIPALLIMLGCVDNVDPKFSSEASGYIISLVGDFEPRQLILIFEDGTGEKEAQEKIAGTDSIVLQHTSGTIRYLIETPLGKSLREIMDHLSENKPSISISPNFITHSNCYGTYILMTEDESEQLYWLNDLGAGLQSVALEHTIRVRGDCIGQDPSGIPVMDAGWVEILGDRVVQKHGTITLVDRGFGETVVILMDDSGAAWELLGPVADEIADIPNIQESSITVNSCERPPSLNSRVGGLEIRVVAYILE